MAHHKRRKPKSRRSGCLYCKPWKHQREGGRETLPIPVRRAMQDDEVKRPICPTWVPSNGQSEDP